MKVTTLPISEIRVGERARREMRNIDSLAKSIRDRGLLQPIVVRPDGGGYALVAGGRRIEAHRLLELEEIPAHVAESLSDELEALLAEGEENTEREKFTPTEAVEQAERIRATVEARAAERRLAGQRAGGPKAAKARLAPAPAAATPAFVEPASLPTLGGKLPPSVAEAPKMPEPKTRDQVAKATGMSGRTLEKARRVVQTAADPEVAPAVREAAREAQQVMDRTGKVDAAFKKVVQAETDIETAAVGDFLEASGAAEELRLKRWNHAFFKELSRAAGFMGSFRPDQVASSIDDDTLTELLRVAADLGAYAERIQALRGRPAGLSLVAGG